MPDYQPDAQRYAPLRTLTFFYGHDLDGNEGKMKPEALIAANQDALRSTVWGTTGGQNLKPQSDTRSGVWDGFNDSNVGYIIHFQSGPNSAAGTASIGVGTDAGLGGGILVSHKNGAFGYRLIQNPGAGYGFYATARAANPVQYTEVYAGAVGPRIQAKLGASFADGVTTAGSNVLQSATANFTAGDVGQTLTQLTSKPGSSFGGIPSGATVVSVTNATTVVMSSNATTTTSGMMFEVAGRALLGTEEFLSFYGTDNVKRGAIAYSLFDWFTGGRFAASFQSQAALIAKAFNASQTGDLFQAVSSANAILSRFNKVGYFMTRASGAPALADMVDGEVALSTSAAADNSIILYKRVGGVLKSVTLTVT